MKYTTFEGNGYAGGSITRRSERTVYCLITTDLHTHHTLQKSAIELLYTDALLSGAGAYTREEFIDAINMLGASIGVSITNSRLTITLRCVEDNLSKLLKLFEVMMLAPQFLSSEIKRTQRQTKNELSEHKENAKAIALENFENSLYVTGDRRYTNTPQQLQTEVSKVSSVDLRKLHSIVLTSLWTVTVGANSNVVIQVQKTIETCKKETKSTQVLRTHAQKLQEPKIILKDIPSKQNIEFSIGTSLPLTLHHPDYLPFVFGLNVLGKYGGFTGRLMSTVREKEGLTYGIYAMTESVEGVEQGHYRIMTFFAPDKAVEGLTSTLREIKKIHKNGITHAEYQRFQTILNTQQTLLTDSLTASVKTLHGYVCADFNLTEIDHYRQRLLTVTRKEINQSLKTHLQPDALIISGAGPIQTVKQSILDIK